MKRNIRDDFNRRWSRIYGVTSGLALIGLGTMMALLIPILGITTAIAGVIMTVFTAVSYKKT